jgi:hypothetical protein
MHTYNDVSTIYRYIIRTFILSRVRAKSVKEKFRVEIVYTSTVSFLWLALFIILIHSTTNSYLEILIKLNVT